MIHIYAVTIGLVIIGIVAGIYYLKTEHPEVLNKILIVIFYLVAAYMIGTIVIAIYLDK